jgi:hypothetical protein
MTLREIPLFNQPYVEVGNAAWFTASGNDRNNTILLVPNLISHGRDNFNYVVYSLDSKARIFRAVLHPSGSVIRANITESVEMQYRIFGDDEKLYESPLMSNNVLPVSVEIDISGFSRLRIELEARTFNTGSFHMNSWHGIQNAVVLVYEY